MNLPANLSERDLIEHLFARVETIEGRLLEYRAVCAAMIRALPEKNLREFMQVFELAQLDALTIASEPAGSYLRGSEVLARNQVQAMKTESRALQDLVLALK